MSNRNYYDIVVARYYKKVDRGDIDWIINIFSKDAVYARADVLFKGRDEIANFYRGDRKIYGTHTINLQIVHEDRVIVQGVFDGKGAKGYPVNVRFCDFWRFCERFVISRETYLALGSDYIRGNKSLDAMDADLNRIES